MKRPNLVNPQNWTPFRSIPIQVPEPILPPLPPLPPLPIQIEIPQIPKPISRKEMVQRNSFYLNLFGLIIILGIAYFLYSIYLERKIFAEYLEYVRNTQEEQYPGFL
jgi:hypothetical protein